MTKYTLPLCRAVLIAKGGKRYPMRWRKNIPPSELGPDEFPAMSLSIKSAERFAQRHKIEIKQINGEYSKGRLLP
jgi:hypothetical protein